MKTTLFSFIALLMVLLLRWSPAQWYYAWVHDTNLFFASIKVAGILAGILAGFFMLKITWNRLDGAWRSWRAQRRLNGLQRRLVEEEEELDPCSICHAEYAAGDEVSPNPCFELS